MISVFISSFNVIFVRRYGVIHGTGEPELQPLEKHTDEDEEDIALFVKDSKRPKWNLKVQSGWCYHSNLIKESRNKITLLTKLEYFGNKQLRPHFQSIIWVIISVFKVVVDPLQ